MPRLGTLKNQEELEEIPDKTSGGIMQGALGEISWKAQEDGRRITHEEILKKNAEKALKESSKTSKTHLVNNLEHLLETLHESPC